MLLFVTVKVVLVEDGEVFKSRSVKSSLLVRKLAIKIACLRTCKSNNWLLEQKKCDL